MEIRESGFKEIPGYSRYLLHESGKLIRKADGSVVTGSVNPAGYTNYRITGDDGKVFTWGRHRLMCYVFKPIENYKNLTVNHVNGIKGDDRLDNLEWTTYQENQEHAGSLGLTEKCRPISIRNCHTGEVKKYPSIVECARELGYTKDTVNWRVKAGPTRIFPDGFQYKFGHDDNWPKIPVEKLKKIFGRSLLVEAKDLKTGKVTTFNKLGDLADHFNISLSTAFNWLNSGEQPVVPGFFQLRSGYNKAPWRKVSDPIAELEAFNGKRFIVLFKDEVPDKVFYGLEEAAKELKMVISTLHRKLKTDVKVKLSDNSYCIYYSSISDFKLKRSIWLEIVKQNSL